MTTTKVSVETQADHVSALSQEPDGHTTTLRNPKDSMKADWYTNPDRSQWTIFHWLIKFLDVYPIDMSNECPVHQKQDKVPHVPWWQATRWITVYNAIPLLLHQLYITYTGRGLGPIPAILFYSICFKLISVREFHMLRDLGNRVGFLDGDAHPRDGVPNVGVRQVFTSLDLASNIRSIFMVFLSYKTAQAPGSINWTMLFVELSIYGIVLDFWFYVYHRIMHDSDTL